MDLVSAGELYTQSGRQRGDYTLTPAGRAALEAEARRLEQAAGSSPGASDRATPVAA